MLTSRRSQSSLVALALAAAIAGAGSATATSITSSTWQSWNATLSGTPTEANFSGISLSNYNTASGITLPAVGNGSVGFTFTGPDNGAYRMTGITFASTKSLAGSTDAGAGLNVAMPSSGENAFLLAVGSTGGTPLTLALSDGENFSLSSGALFGISISHPISSLLLTTSAGSEAVIDDFYFGVSNLAQDPTGGSGSGSGGSVSPSGEVATSFMMAGGLLTIFGACRKFRTPQSA